MPSDFNISYHPPVSVEIQVQDIIMHMSYNYALLMMLMSIALLAYVLWKVFIIKTSPRALSIDKDLDEYMIVPALFLTAVTVSYFIAL